MHSLAQQLVTDGLLSQEQAEDAVAAARTQNLPIAFYLVQKQLLSSAVIAKAVSQHFNLPLYDISTYNVKHAPSKFPLLESVKKRCALPIFQRGNKIVIATVSPDISELAHIDVVSDMETEFVIVEADKLNAAIEEVADQQIATEGSKAAAKDEEYVFRAKADMDNGVNTYSESAAAANFITEVADETPLVQFLNQMITDAVTSKASDIHFEPYADNYRIRYRQDGVLYEIAKPPIEQAQTIVARLKVMANLDISEHRVPQDGRFKMTIEGAGVIDFRISTCPTMYGEKVVLRILDSSATELSISDLGMDKSQEKPFLHAISQSQGMILVTGPTGSGKTVTLYSALRILNTTEKNISTIEDPVEIYMEGVNQVQVNMKTGMTFAATLRSFLRQDPDIMMVGEIRDKETAEIGIKAAQTGHLVLSTLHTNSAPLTITRLVNMGAKPFDIVGSVILIVAQRLVRKLCPHCKQEVKKSNVRYKSLKKLLGGEDVVLYEPGSCKKCIGGYKGRIGVFEVMTISNDMAELIIVGASTPQMAKLAQKEGIMSMADSGIKKIKQGLTSFEEVSRVITLE